MQMVKLKVAGGSLGLAKEEVSSCSTLGSGVCAAGSELVIFMMNGH